MGLLTDRGDQVVVPDADPRAAGVQPVEQEVAALELGRPVAAAQRAAESLD